MESPPFVLFTTLLFAEFLKYHQGKFGRNKNVYSELTNFDENCRYLLLYFKLTGLLKSLADSASQERKLQVRARE
jgi:hypothetical protein